MPNGGRCPGLEHSHKDDFDPMKASELPAEAKRFWDGFLAAEPGYADAPLYEAFCFGDSEALADELAGLVLAGTKRATASLLWAYEAEKEALPQPGKLSIMTNWAGNPLCILRTGTVEIVPFEEVSVEFARTEGEGDKSLAYWREAHWAFFSRECANIGRQPEPRMLVVCETFSVVYPPAVANGSGRRRP